MQTFWSSSSWGRAAEGVKTLAAALLIAALCATGTLWVDPLPAPPDVEAVLAARRAPEAMADVRRLCSEAFGGRKAGTPGADRAADWLAEQFRRIGLEPAPEAPGFRQRLTMPVSLLASRWDRKAKLVGGARRPGGANRSSLLVEYPCFRGEGFSAEAEAVFAGWGISRRDQGWDDYQGRDVRGKYVVLWEGPAGPGLDRADPARWRDAHARGALGCLVISHRTGAPPAGLENPIRDFPVLRLDPASAQRVLDTRVPAPGTRSAGVPAPVRIEIPRAVDPARPAANVIGMIRGSDPDLAGEAVLLSAHYDHLGAAAAGLYRGADDDASGVAVVLGVARALRALGQAPRRTVLFCLWTGEECGLVGSRAYVERPLVPLDRTRFVLQVEMVGAGHTDAFLTSSARLAGAGYAWLQAAADRLGLSLAADTCRGVSDHMAFLRRGVPSAVITTAGEHPDYHTTRDSPDRIQPAGIENAIRLCALALWKQAN